MRALSWLAAAFFLGATSAWAEPAVFLAGQAGAAAAPQPETWRRYEEARQLTVRDAAVVLRISPEDRADIAVAVVNAGPLASPTVQRSGRRLVIDGRVGGVQRCSGRGAQTSRQGLVAWEQLPQIWVRVPRAAAVAVDGAAKTEIGPADSARYAFSGCGEAVFGPVSGELDLAVTGAGDVQGGAAGSARVVLASAGDVVIGDVRDGLTISLAGSGDVSTGEVHGGDVRIVVQGSGDITLGEGDADTVSIIVAGSGDVTFPGSAQSLDAVVAGSGDVMVGRVEGRVSRRVAGSGEIVVGGRD